MQMRCQRTEINGSVSRIVLIGNDNSAAAPLIANKWNAANGLSALQIQLLAISVFRSSSGRGGRAKRKLEAFRAHLGFGKYVAVDRSLVFPKDLPLTEDPITPALQGGRGCHRPAATVVWLQCRDVNAVLVAR